MSLSARAFNPQPEPPRFRRAMTFGDAGATAGGVGDAANMVNCIAAGGTWQDGVCIVGEGGGGEGGTVDLNTGDGSTPGAVPVREANWDVEHKPWATYKITSGDTFVGLAATYLGDGARWPEIWNTGGNRAKFPSPDVINNTGPLDMPNEARDRFVAWTKTGKQGLPGDLPKSQVDKANRPVWPYVAAGVGALVLGGAAIYLAS